MEKLEAIASNEYQKLAMFDLMHLSFLSVLGC
jgi:hypothetical protein